jgi:hypothetical protein
MSKKVTCVVTGMHRSGTTWLGKAIGSIPGRFVLEEPFNFDHGLAGIPRWYPDCQSSRDVSFLRSALAEIEAGTAKYQRKFHADRPLASLSAILRGNRSERAYRTFLGSLHTQIALKDPFLLMMVPELTSLGIRSIVSVRHPGAILKSLRRMKWPIPNEHLRGRGTGGEISAAKDGEIAAICAFWSGVYRPVIDMARAGGSPLVHIAIHETMFNDAEGLARRLASFQQIETRAGYAAFSKFIQSSTESRTVTPDHRRQHDLTRNSRALASSWTAGFSQSELQQFTDLIGEDYGILKRAAGSRCQAQAGAIA